MEWLLESNPFLQRQMANPFTLPNQSKPPINWSSLEAEFDRHIWTSGSLATLGPPLLSLAPASHTLLMAQPPRCQVDPKKHTYHTQEPDEKRTFYWGGVILFRFVGGDRKEKQSKHTTQRGLKRVTCSEPPFRSCV